MAEDNKQDKPKTNNPALAYENIAFDSRKFLAADTAADTAAAVGKQRMSEQEADINVTASLSAEDKSEFYLADKKLIILRILQDLPNLDNSELCNLCLSSIYLDYFTYADCLAELCNRGLIAKNAGKYRLTNAGQNVLRSLYATLPKTARSTLEEIIRNAKLSR